MATGRVSIVCTSLMIEPRNVHRTNRIDGGTDKSPLSAYLHPILLYRILPLAVPFRLFACSCLQRAVSDFSHPVCAAQILCYEHTRVGDITAANQPPKNSNLGVGVHPARFRFDFSPRRHPRERATKGKKGRVGWMAW